MRLAMLLFNSNCFTFAVLVTVLIMMMRGAGREIDNLNLQFVIASYQ